MNKTSRGLKKGTGTRHKWEPKLVDKKKILKNTIYIQRSVLRLDSEHKRQAFAGTKHFLSPVL